MINAVNSDFTYFDNQETRLKDLNRKLIVKKEKTEEQLEIVARRLDLIKEAFQKLENQD